MDVHAHVHHLLATPRAVYGAAWSPDGARLAVCGGFFYGEGYLQVIGEVGRPRAELSGAALTDALRAHDSGAAPMGVILSSICWDDTGSVLLAAACSDKWHGHPPILFAYDGDSTLRLRGVAASDEDKDGPKLSDDRATGCWLHRDRIVLRRRSVELHRSLAVLPHPAAQGLHADERRSALQNARLTIIDDVAYTAKNLAGVHSTEGTGPPRKPGSELRLHPHPHGLAYLDLRAPSATPGLTPLPHEEKVQAVVRDPAGTTIFWALTDRTILRWNVIARGVLERAGSWEHPRGADPGDGVVVRGITALCFMADGQTLVSADHAGAVHFWRGSERVASAQIPDGYSPRCLAAHPSKPRVAVGCKPFGGARPGGAVFSVGLEAR